jgi:hypothetical protein
MDTATVFVMCALLTRLWAELLWWSDERQEERQQRMQEQRKRPTPPATPPPSCVQEMTGDSPQGEASPPW